MIKALIFDMDGVVTDTEYYDHQVQLDFIESLGGHATDEETAGLIGKSYDDFYNSISEFLPGTYTTEEVGRMFDKFSEEKYRDLDYRPLFREDIVDVLKFAKANNVKLAMASSSTKKHVEEVLEQCGILNYFDVIISGEMFESSKPNPDIYLHTLKELDVSAKETVTVEDSYYGIKAATSAGIYTFGYRDTRLPVDQSRADKMIDGMTDLLDELRRRRSKDKSGL